MLFGIVGALLVGAVWRSELRPLAYAVGIVSAASFLAVAWQVGGYNAAIARVVWADVVALGCLAVGAGLEWQLRRAR